MAFGTTDVRQELDYMVGTSLGDGPRIARQLNDLESNLSILLAKLDLLAQDLTPVLKKSNSRLLGPGKLMSTDTSIQPSEISILIDGLSEKVGVGITQVGNLRNNLDI